MSRQYRAFIAIFMLQFMIAGAAIGAFAHLARNPVLKGEHYARH